MWKSFVEEVGHVIASDHSYQVILKPNETFKWFKTENQKLTEILKKPRKSADVVKIEHRRKENIDCRDDKNYFISKHDLSLVSTFDMSTKAKT